MPDPIWLDNNIVDRAFKGDIDIRNNLAAYRQQGRRLLIVPWVQTEFLDGNWTADTGTSPKGRHTPPVGERGMQGAQRAQAEAFLKQSGIELDMSAAKLPNKTRQSYIWDTKAPSGEVSNQDRMVLGQVKASAEAQGVKNPQIYTAEKGGKAMVSQAKGWGVTPVEHIEPPKPPAGKPPAGKPPAGNPPAGKPPAGTPPAGGAPPSAGTSAGKAAKAQTRTLAPRAPRIDLSEFPPERPGRVTRFFNDRPALKKAGLIGGNMALGQIKSSGMAAIQSHFEEAVEKGGKEFRAAFPTAADIAKKYDLDRLKRGVNAQLAEAVRAASLGPPDPRAFGADRVAGLKALVAYLKGVKAKPGALKAFDAAAQAYVDAMADAATEMDGLRRDLGPILADIDKRAAVLQHAASYLIDLFWEVLPAAVSVPFVYYEWLDVKSLGDSLDALARAVGGLAGEMRATAGGYEASLTALHAELQAISEAINRYGPAGAP